MSNNCLNADPAAVVFDAIGAAKSKNTDLLLVDTAGRVDKFYKKFGKSNLATSKAEDPVVEDSVVED